MTQARPRVAIVDSHPVQYHSPWYRALAEHCELRVFYAHRQTAEGQAAAGYGTAFEWDVDLLAGYAHEFVPNVASEPNVYRFGGCDNPALGERISEGRFDAVIVSGWYLKCYWQGALAAKRLDLPLLVRGDSQLPTPRSLWKRAAKELTYPPLLAQFAACLTVGTRNREYLVHYRVRDERIFLVPYFADPRVFRVTQPAERATLRAALGLREEDTAVLFVGRLIDVKRPLDVAYALRRLRGRSRRFVGLFVGAGPLADTLVSAAQDGDELRLLGFRNQSELPGLYAAADVVVQPATSETWGLVVNEAMACGRPVVASDGVGCAVDLIEPGRSGFVYPAGDVPALAEALASAAELARSPVLRSTLADINRRNSSERAVTGTLDALRYVARGGG